MSTQSPTSAARNSAVAMLSRRALTEAELRERLLRKGHEPDAVSAAIEFVRTCGYVNDSAVAEAIVREAQRKGRGMLWIQQKLRMRGVDKSHADALIQSLTHSHKQSGAYVGLHRLQQLVAKRFGDISNLDQKQKQKLYRFLAQRGFSHEVSARVMNMNMSEGEAEGITNNDDLNNENP